jgi:HEPN domain-containing protein
MVLLAEVVKLDSGFGDYRKLCQELAEFAVDVRYPGGISEPPEGEASRFIAGAEEVLVLVEQILGTE